jgi:hypothetical protein
LKLGATAKTSDNWLESSFGFDDLLKGLGDQKSAESSDHLLLIIPPSTKKDDKSENVQKLNGRHSHRKKVFIFIIIFLFIRFMVVYRKQASCSIR